MREHIIDFLLLKLASRCNLNCSYCYWFADGSVYKQPKIISEEIEAVLLRKLEEHVKKYHLKHFRVLLHGGEPLLFPKERFRSLVAKLREIPDIELALGITTNGVLLDDEWASIFLDNNIEITVSLDGPKRIHDMNRSDFRQRGTFEKVMAGLEVLTKHGLSFGVLAVANVEFDPIEITDFFVSRGIKQFDVLIPDANHRSKPISISPYFRRLYSHWYSKIMGSDIRLRSLENMTRALLGFATEISGVGHAPLRVVSLNTDGSLEPLDVLRFNGEAAVKTNATILANNLQDVTSDPVWLEAYNASINLPKECRACEFCFACGGGYLPHRWSDSRKYDNPSVYCQDMKEILGHAWSIISPDVALKKRMPKNNESPF